MSKLDYIKSKCIKANPEIMELTFGCEMKLHIDSFGSPNESNSNAECSPEVNRVIRWIGGNEIYIPEIGDITKSEVVNGHWDEDRSVTFEIIGHPIQLADVLYTFWQDSPIRLSITDEGFITIHEEDGDVEQASRWDLTQPLDNQSEETINYLADLLGFKE